MPLTLRLCLVLPLVLGVGIGRQSSAIVGLATANLATIDGTIALPTLRADVRGAGYVGRAAYLRPVGRRSVLRSGLRDGPGPSLADGDVAPRRRRAPRRDCRTDGGGPRSHRTPAQVPVDPQTIASSRPITRTPGG